MITVWSNDRHAKIDKHLKVKNFIFLLHLKYRFFWLWKKLLEMFCCFILFLKNYQMSRNNKKNQRKNERRLNERFYEWLSHYDLHTKTHFMIFSKNCFRKSEYTRINKLSYYFFCFNIIYCLVEFTAWNTKTYSWRSFNSFWIL